MMILLLLDTIKKNDGMQDAMKEMMERIQKGHALRSVVDMNARVSYLMHIYLC